MQSTQHITKQYLIQPAKFKLDGGAMFGIIPKPLWERKIPADSKNRIQLALRLWLIDLGHRLILIDTGIGEDYDDKFLEQFEIVSGHEQKSHYEDNCLSKSLQKLGYSAKDVTDLVLSHLHFDHAGGLGFLSKEKVQTPLLPNATLHLHADHYAYSKSPSMRDRGSFHDYFYGPIIDYYIEKDQVHWLQGEQGTIIEAGLESLHFLSSNGHTPHLVHPYNERFIYLADIIPTHAHIHLPWVMGYDIGPGISCEDKQRILSFIEQKDLTVIFEHDPDFWGAKIESHPKGKWFARQCFEAPELGDHQKL